MAGNFNKGKGSSEISELAALSDDISDDFIDQLQNKLAGNADAFSNNNKDDAALFEEPASPAVEPVQELKTDVKPETNSQNATESTDDVKPETEKKSQNSSAKTETSTSSEKKEEKSVNTNFDDNFIKKYKAKLNKKTQSASDKQDSSSSSSSSSTSSSSSSSLSSSSSKSKFEQSADDGGEPIENVSKGNIVEKPLNKEQKEYNESLDFLDGNVKYSKYVIYIDPQNVDFIDGLTVKERKNLINGILRQQDDIAITRQRFKVIQTIIRQSIVAVITIAIAIPIVYTAINASLEATINNHRNAQTNWQTLYREHGKITQN